MALLSPRFKTETELKKVDLGHVLLGAGFAPVHVNDTRNLMNVTTSTITSMPTLTVKQLATIRKSAVCRAV